jgi:hypothetical protein
MGGVFCWLEAWGWASTNGKWQMDESGTLAGGSWQDLLDAASGQWAAQPQTPADMHGNGKALDLINQLMPRGPDSDVGGDYEDEDIEHASRSEEPEERRGIRRRGHLD